MAVRALDPGAFGFPTKCFVCDLDNRNGLRVPFSYDEDAKKVFADFTLGPAYSGAPQYVHGGAVLSVIDEAMAWAAIASAGRFAVVRETTTTFEHGVRVGQPHRVEAEVETVGTIRMQASARVVDADGRRCARSRARLVVLSEEAAKSAIGTVEGDDRRYLRPARPERNDRPARPERSDRPARPERNDRGERS